MSTALLRHRPVARTTARLLDTLAPTQGIDRYLAIAFPTWSTTEVRGRVIEVSHATADSVTLRIRPNRNWAGFTAGQYTQLNVEIDGVRMTRCYSLAGSAGRPGLIELTIKANPQGAVSRHLVDHAHPGMVVGLTPAQGDFTLPADRPAHLLLVSGGSGITPVMSMLRTLCDEGHTGAVTFVHYALTAADHIYRTELDAIAAAHPNVRVVRSYTDAPGTGDVDGFFTADQLDTIEPAWRDTAVFVCGPAPLMDAVTDHYEAAGRVDQVRREAFKLAGIIAEAGTTGGTLRFDNSQTVVVDDGRTLLEQAEAAGLDPKHGCRMGICHTCTRRLSRGTVRNAVTGELTDQPDTEIRICVSVPVGDVAVDL